MTVKELALNHLQKLTAATARGDAEKKRKDGGDREREKGQYKLNSEETVMLPWVVDLVSCE